MTRLVYPEPCRRTRWCTQSLVFFLGFREDKHLRGALRQFLAEPSTRLYEAILYFLLLFFIFRLIYFFLKPLILLVRLSYLFWQELILFWQLSYLLWHKAYLFWRLVVLIWQLFYLFCGLLCLF